METTNIIDNISGAFDRCLLPIGVDAGDFCQASNTLVTAIITADCNRTISLDVCKCIVKLFDDVQNISGCLVDALLPFDMRGRIALLKTIIVKPAAAVLGCDVNNHSLKTAIKLLTGHYLVQLAPEVDRLQIAFGWLDSGPINDFLTRNSDNSHFLTEFNRFMIEVGQYAVQNVQAESDGVSCDDMPPGSTPKDGARDISRAQSIALLHEVFIRLGATQRYSASAIAKLMEAVTSGMVRDGKNSYAWKRRNDKLQAVAAQLLAECLAEEQPPG